MKKLEKLKTMLLSREAHARITLGMAITLLTFIIAGVWGFAKYTSKMENQCNINYTSIEDLKPIVAKNTDDLHKIEISDVENRTRIINIEARVVEILTILKDND